MAQSRRKRFQTAKGSHLLKSVLSVQFAYSVVMLTLLNSGRLDSLVSPALRGLLSATAAFLIFSAFYAVWRDRKIRHGATSKVRGLKDHIDSVLHRRQEWWWATDDLGTFTFSSGASLDLLGYAPSELEGRSASMVMDLDDLSKARHSTAAAMAADASSWAGVIVRCRHRDGTPVWMEVSGHARPALNGVSTGFQGSGRPLLHQSAPVLAVQRTREKIEQMLRERTLLTAFHPIHDLTASTIVGVEALARFTDNEGGPEHWFSQAADVGPTTELEFQALKSALTAAEEVPSHLYVALNISPETCLDARLPGYLAASRITPDRLVLELTENLPVAAYAPLIDALNPLRSSGVRIAVDSAGAGFASMRHILHLHPDIIKLDRSLIAGIDQSPSQQALGAAMVDFAHQIQAQLVAEGIESAAELKAVTELGMHAGQGYLLDRPTVDPQKWAIWEGPTERAAA